MNWRQKAKELVEMAVRSDTPEKERVAAAFKAISLIHKHDLLSSPLDLLDGENETAQAAKSIVETLFDPGFRNNVKRVASGITRARERVRRR